MHTCIHVAFVQEAFIARVHLNVLLPHTYIHTYTFYLFKKLLLLESDGRLFLLRMHVYITCLHTYIHTYVHMQARKVHVLFVQEAFIARVRCLTPTYIHTYIDTYIQVLFVQDAFIARVRWSFIPFANACRYYMHTYIHTYIHTYTCRNVSVLFVQEASLLESDVYSHIHTCTHTYIHTYIIHTCMHARSICTRSFHC